ncbi:hypothetical protein [Methanobacterium sp.]|uniref:hypothetical protein n=1 Tax=Methanobacterium sp. TaxID=2164 RepID=UPI0025F4A8FD|nr:hypothetical protein [Methanobacterium sp.]MBI5458758.1 hypothetical protein [Methanobacterium sp.]
MLVALMNNSLIFGGFCIFGIVLSMFEIKKFDNNKLLLLIGALILAISLILAYFQLSSLSYSGNKLFNYFFAIVFILTVLLWAYDLTHDYELSKISLMENVSQKMKNLLAILLLVLGVIVGLLIGVFFFNI